MLSDLGDGHDSSIISHISIEQMGKSRFDKWDILYQDDAEWSIHYFNINKNDKQVGSIEHFFIYACFCR